MYNEFMNFHSLHFSSIIPFPFYFLKSFILPGMKFICPNPPFLPCFIIIALLKGFSKGTHFLFVASTDIIVYYLFVASTDVIVIIIVIIVIIIVAVSLLLF